MEGPNTEIFERLPVPKAVQKMILPTIMGQMIVLIYNMADTFFLGRTGNPYMVAGASLILPVFNISLALSAMASMGGGPLISRMLGVKRIEEARKVSSFCIYLSLLFSLSFSLLILAFIGPIMNLLGADADTLPYARSYAMCVLVIGCVPTVLSNALANLLRSVGESKKSGFGITMGGIINIALDPLFMFVLLPDGMEVVGAGVATAISNLIACVYFVVQIIRLGPDSALKLYRITKLPEKASMRETLVMGLPAAANNLLFDLDYAIIGRLMSAYNGIAVAAAGIVLKVERLPLNIGVGICQGMVPIVAYNYSAGNMERMKKTVRYSRRLGLICAAASILLYELFASQLVNFFILNADTVALGTEFLRIRILATPFMFLCFFTFFMFNAFGKGFRAMFLTVMRWAVFNIPMLFILEHFFGIYGIVWAQLAADLIAASVSLLVYNRFEKTLFSKKAEASVQSA